MIFAMTIAAPRHWRSTATVFRDHSADANLFFTVQCIIQWSMHNLRWKQRACCLSCSSNQPKVGPLFYVFVQKSLPTESLYNQHFVSLVHFSTFVQMSF